MLAFVLLTGFAVVSVSASEPVYTKDQQKVYDMIIALKSDYPEGMSWTNDNYYQWKGGYYSGGYGCAGFAFILSDAAFGDAQMRFVYDVSMEKLRVGDILRINNDTHSVVVLSVEADGVIIAEGNYNRSIHWGRKLSVSAVSSATYLMTRYADDPGEEQDPPEENEYLTTEGILYNVSPGTVYDDFVKHFENDAAVINNKGETVGTGELICSGYTVTIGNSQFCIAVKGDVNGDGDINSTDYILIRLHFLKINQLDNEYLKAADTDLNGFVDTTDYISVKRHILKLFEL